MKWIAGLLFFFLAPGCIYQPPEDTGDLFTTRLEHHLISSGDNRPNINLYKDSLDYFLYALHTGMGTSEFARSVGWSTRKLDSAIAQLKRSDFLKTDSTGKLQPTCMLVTQETGLLLHRQARQVATEIADSIQATVPAIRSHYQTMPVAAHHPFDSVAFFLLSNVLLDNWQINQVEKQFVQADRSRRHGKNYFYQIAVLNPADSNEVFGIYGNQVLCNDSLCVAVYGNRRNGINLSNYFESPRLLLLSPADEAALDAMAEAFMPILLQVLKHHELNFKKEYQASAYRNQISYAEYFMWYYHFIYTRATDLLIERGIIHLPAGHNFFYAAKK